MAMKGIFFFAFLYSMFELDLQSLGKAFVKEILSNIFKVMLLFFIVANCSLI